MPQLTLTGLSRDGTHLLLMDDQGTAHTLAVDSVLRAAVRGEHDRTAQLEIQMESALRPRDIQARIRAGESPEAVAQAAQTNLERIMPYAAPVLAEREHMAERAQSSSVRRSGEGVRVLGEAVAAQLRAHQVDPSTLEWDAWRREDGRWTLTALYETPDRSAIATFSFDVRGNFVTADDDDAKWLIGDARAVSPATPARDDLREARERRLTTPGEHSQAVVEPTPEGTHEASPSAAEPTADLTGVREGVGIPTDEPLPWDIPLPGVPEPTNEHPSAQPGSDDAGRKPNRRKGRASVPSWDEIMFGGGGRSE